MLCQNCGKDIGNMTVCSYCGYIANGAGSVPPRRTDDYGHMNSSAYPQMALDMKWYKFIIYFQLFLSALINVSYAGRYFSGLDYGKSAALVYQMYSSLRILDIFMGIASLALAGWSLYTRERLRKFKKNAVFAYLSLPIIKIVCTCIYMIVGWTAVGNTEGMDIAAMSSNISMQIGLLIWNYIYFKKRKHMFVN